VITDIIIFAISIHSLHLISVSSLHLFSGEKKLLTSNLFTIFYHIALTHTHLHSAQVAELWKPQNF